MGAKDIYSWMEMRLSLHIAADEGGLACCRDAVAALAGQTKLAERRETHVAGLEAVSSTAVFFVERADELLASACANVTLLLRRLEEHPSVVVVVATQLNRVAYIS